jgi:adenosylcobinamide kinase/adenosylcobinamide-phosphate guanylyltransferase
MNSPSHSAIALVLGGARSGKSSFAESCAHQFPTVTYFATAQVVAGDKEMEHRIAKHQKRRPTHWKTVEPPNTIDHLTRMQQESPSDCIVVDCATLWLGWGLTENYKKYSKEQLLAHMEIEIQHFIETLQNLRTTVLVVSNETGCGVVPEHASGRMFRDLQGILNTNLARVARAVCLVVAGQPLLIKHDGEENGASNYLPLARVSSSWVAGVLRGTSKE